MIINNIHITEKNDIWEFIGDTLCDISKKRIDNNRNNIHMPSDVEKLFLETLSTHYINT